MTQEFVIRKMKQEEVQIAIDWARQEGWNPGLHDAASFYQADPNGFFMGLLDGEPIATGAAVAYDEHFAFCGLYIVKPGFRGKGYGMQLTQARLNYVGSRITGIDGVLENVAKYQKIGYVPLHSNIRYALTHIPNFVAHSSVVNLLHVPFQQLEEFDRRYFPAPRVQFLSSWINQQNAESLAYYEAQYLCGYGVIRKCFQGYKIGPLFAETPVVAHALFESLCANKKEGPIYLDVPQPNENAQLLAQAYHMTPSFEVMRMYRNGSPTVDLQGIYGMTTYEIG